MKFWRVVFLCLVATLFILDVQAQGCSQCKMLAEQSAVPGEAAFGSNINKGILFLMAIPYILLFFLFRKKLAVLFKKR